jgi:enterochelin esterase-like enzyme
MFVKKSITAAMAISALGAFGEVFKWPAPPNGYDKNDGLTKGTLTASITYPTRNHGDRNVRVYTPPGYSATRAEKYPVLYLHHGVGGNENAWVSQAGHAEGNADRVMDYLYAQTNLKVTPMIVVMPMGNMTGTSDPWRTYEDVLLKDLIPYIESKYNASSDPNLRAMAGLSMGGGQTSLFAYRNLNTFTWIGAFSPAPSWGDPTSNIKDIEGVKTKVHLNYFSGGTDELNPFLTLSRSYHSFLNQNGVTKLILQEEQSQGHSRESWNRNLHHFAQRIFNLEPTSIQTFAQFNATKRAALRN